MQRSQSMARPGILSGVATSSVSFVNTKSHMYLGCVLKTLHSTANKPCSQNVNKADLWQLPATHFAVLSL